MFSDELALREYDYGDGDGAFIKEKITDRGAETGRE